MSAISEVHRVVKQQGGRAPTKTARLKSILAKECLHIVPNLDNRYYLSCIPVNMPDCNAETENPCRLMPPHTVVQDLDDRWYSCVPY